MQLLRSSILLEKIQLSWHPFSFRSCDKFTFLYYFLAVLIIRLCDIRACYDPVTFVFYDNVFLNIVDLNFWILKRTYCFNNKNFSAKHATISNPENVIKIMYFSDKKHISDSIHPFIYAFPLLYALTFISEQNTATYFIHNTH